MEQKRTGIGVSKKILAICLSFTLPISVLAYLVVKNINEFISFADYEMAGDYHQTSLEEALRSVQGYKLAMQSQDKKLSQEYLDKSNAAFASIGKADKEVGELLQYTDAGLGKRGRASVKYDLVLGRWNEIAAMKGGYTDNFAKAIDAMIADIRTMIVHTGDTSNLILDPDLDSYYLMDVTLLALPQNQGRIASVMSWGYDLIANNKMTAKDRVQLLVHAAMLQEADHDRVDASTKTSLTEDPNFYGLSGTLQANLANGLAAYKGPQAEFIALAKKIGEGENVSAEKWMAAGWKAYNASFDYWFVAVKEMDILLKTRIKAYDSRKTWSLVLSSLALLFSMVLSFIVSMSITKPLISIVELLGPGAVLLMESVKRISQLSQKLGSGGEQVGIITEELEAHATDMRKTVGRLESVVHGGSEK